MDTNIKVICTLLISLFISEIGKAQIVFYPKFGLLRNYYTRVGGSPYIIEALSHGDLNESIDNKEKIYRSMVGLDLAKKINRHNFIFSYDIRQITLANSVLAKPYYAPPDSFALEVPSGHAISPDLKLFGLSYGYDFNFHFIKKRTRNTSGATPALDAIIPQKHWINFSVTPILGAGINYVRATNWAGYAVSEDGTCTEGAPDTTGNGLSVGSGLGWDTYDCDDLDKIVKNRTGLVLYGGVKLAFLKQEKERLSINFNYHQTFQTYLEASYSTYIDGVSDVQTATFATRGTTWSIFLSYPITILNKKGERYRDRHPRGGF